MIDLQHITKTFHGREGDFTALNNVSLHIEKGEVFGILGSSGAGKSTLVRHINLLERPSEGTVSIDGVDVTGYTGRELRTLREGVGMIFQNFNLFQQRTALQNVLFPLQLRHVDRSQADARARELIDLVGLNGMESRYPSELSGGQQQRVAIARALANEPAIMLCDEATSALDSKTTIQILDLLRDINRRLGVTIVIITHSITVARHACDRIAVLDRGSVVEEGRVEQVLDDPQSPITRALLAYHEGTRGESL